LLVRQSEIADRECRKIKGGLNENFSNFPSPNKLNQYFYLFIYFIYLFKKKHT